MLAAAAALSGAVFDLADLAAVAQAPLREVVAVVRRMETAGVVVADDTGYRFRHEQLRGVYGNVVAGPVFTEIADKIYSNRLEMQTLVAQADTVYKAPASFGGNRADLLTVMEALKIPVDVQGEGEWATTQATDSTVVIGTRAVASDETGMMPNVIGMGLRDAMYILENHGLRVRLSGSGMVKRQSPAPGTRSMKGSTVTLELAT